MTSLVLRADTGRAIGCGHLMRMIALAEQHRAWGGDACLALGSDAGDLAAVADRRGLRVATIRAATGSADDAVRLARLARRLGAHTCVVDGYRFSAAYVRTVRDHGPSVVAIDDLDRDLGADLTVRPTPERTTHRRTGELRGSHYALLRAEFLARPRGRRHRARGPLRALLSFGGTDPTRSAARVLRSFPHAGDVAEVSATVAVGAGYRDDGELQAAAELARARGHSVELARDVADMAQLMVDADVAVCAAGTVLLELAYFACPTLAFVVADNQAPSARALEREVLVGGRIDALADADIRALIVRLVGDAALRRRLSNRFGALVDGQGCERVLRAVTALSRGRAA